MTSLNRTTLNLYCAGGSAINLGRSFNQYRGQSNDGYADINTYFIDTSRSNMDPDVPEAATFLFDGVDGKGGSGKVRNANYPEIAERSPEILHKFKPSAVNVVLHSASGGSGSAIGPVLVSEMLARGEMVIVLMVGSTSSKKEIENTVNTFKSYESISAKRGAPVVAYYRENSTDMSRGEVDKQIQLALVLLATLFSGQNRELDMADLRNFINYQKVTSYAPHLVCLDFFSKEIKLEAGENLLTVASLTNQSAPTELSIPTEYQAVGFLPETMKDAIKLDLPVHACVLSGHFNTAMKRLENKLKVYSDLRTTVVEKSIVSASDSSTPDGLVF